MSILQKAFTFVTSPMQDADFNAFYDYIEPLSHEGVPGEKRWLTLRGVSTTTAYVRLLSEMLEVSMSQGGTSRVSLKGLALQLIYLASVRDRPIWKADELTDRFYVNFPNDALAENFVSLLMKLKSANQDQMVEIKWDKDVPFELLDRYARAVDENYDTHPLATDGKSKLEEYLLLATYADTLFLTEV